MKAAQLSLFDETVRHELEQARTEIAWLRARLDTAIVEYRKLRDSKEQAPCQECQDGALTVATLRRQVTTLIAERDAARRMSAIWKSLLDLSHQEQQQGTYPPTYTPSRDELTQLLKLAHPDRWNQGQPATELAHELSVAVNQLRARTQA